MFTVIHSDSNGGNYVNVLRALALTDTDYFCALDPDDYWIDDTYLQSGFAFLEAHPDFVIYSRNCVQEFANGRREPVIPHETPDGEYSFEDYIRDRAVISNTIGTIFRNVIFQAGIPQFFVDIIGTQAADSFRGDYGRYTVHIARGRARFVNRIAGVYRRTGRGLWTQLSTFEQNLTAARAELNYWMYFGYEYPEHFLAKAHVRAIECLRLMNQSVRSLSSDVEITPQQAADVWDILSHCLSRREAFLNRDVLRGPFRPRSYLPCNDHPVLDAIVARATVVLNRHPKARRTALGTRRLAFRAGNTLAAKLRQ